MDSPFALYDPYAPVVAEARSSYLDALLVPAGSKRAASISVAEQDDCGDAASISVAEQDDCVDAPTDGRVSPQPFAPTDGRVTPKERTQIQDRRTIGLARLDRHIHIQFQNPPMDKKRVQRRAHNIQAEYSLLLEHMPRCRAAFQMKPRDLWQEPEGPELDFGEDVVNGARETLPAPTDFTTMKLDTLLGVLTLGQFTTRWTVSNAEEPNKLVLKGTVVGRDCTIKFDVYSGEVEFLRGVMLADVCVRGDLYGFMVGFENYPNIVDFLNIFMDRAPGLA